MKFVLAVLGVALTLLGGGLCVVANLNLGSVMTLILGILFLLAVCYWEKLRVLTKSGIGRILKFSVVILFCAFLGFVTFLAGFGGTESVDYTEDAVIVLGAGIRGDQVTQVLQYRLDSAVEYYQKNPNALIVVSGGQGLQETVTEAYAMERYLLQRGIPQSAILKEERATSTWENMQFSKMLLDESFAKEYSVAVITNHFHLYRGVRYAKRAGFLTVTRKGAPLQWYQWIPCYLRESLAVLKLWIGG